jgi:RNA methyltransferase, TrmH family
MAYKQVAKQKELKICGFHACIGILNSQSELIIRLYFISERKKDVKSLMQFCAQKKLAYHEVTKIELEKISESTHHEGVCLLIKAPKPVVLKDLLNQKDQKFILALEGVENPHNLGALLRSAAHFGISGIILKKKTEVFTPAFFRTAEGGALKVPICVVDDFSWISEAKKQGWDLLTTTSHGGQDLYQKKFTKKVIVVMGSEQSGVTEELFKLIPSKMKISGTGWVESLNVAQAATLMMGEWYRQQKVGS